jgi:putative transposase
MSYISNPYAPKARRLAVNLVKTGKESKASVARIYGVHRATIGKWLERASKHSREHIVTRSSRPKSHPNQVPAEIVNRLIELRLKLGRCAPVIHAHLLLEGYEVSLSSVGRILKRRGLTRRKKQAKYYVALPRPVSDCLGALVQVDTIHFVREDTSRFYVYTLIDTYSRLTYAEYHPKLSQKKSLLVVRNAQKAFGFKFNTVQTDSGPEFRDHFNFELKRIKVNLRHSRVRTPNDNAHVERFNRTLQEECFQGRRPNERTIKEELKKYINYYNNDRLHLSLDLLTPNQFVAKVLN